MTRTDLLVAVVLLLVGSAVVKVGRLIGEVLGTVLGAVLGVVVVAGSMLA